QHLGAGSGLIFGRDLVLAYGAEATQPAALADVGILAEPVDGVEDVGTRTELGPASAAIGTRRFGLKPVEKPQAHPLGVLERSRLRERWAVEDRRVAVVVAGPIDHADVARVDTWEERVVDQPPIGPQSAFRARRPIHHRVVEPAGGLAVDLAAVDVDAERIRLAVAVV